MKKLILFLLIATFVASCRQEKSNVLESEFLAEVVNFDLNCNTCILKFPNDSLTIKQEIGESSNNYYGTVNFDKSTYKIGQRFKIKLRKPENEEFKSCITLYPSFNYKPIYILEFKEVN